MLVRPKALLTSAFIYAGILIVTLIAADAACYLFLPWEIARKFNGYKVPAEEVIAPYPKDYFTSHPTRGFDIRPGARGEHRVDGVAYPIWSNRFGCFDREWQDVPAGYYYFAGDSNTWGYTPYEQKFGTLFEKHTGIPSLKCGVTHTGQLHQFEKFQEIVRKAGTPPKHVIVGYCANDIANDYAHPHSTVVDGWMFDDVFLDVKDCSTVRVDRDWIKEKGAEVLSRQRIGIPTNAFWAAVKGKIRQYSISSHVLNGAFHRARTALASDSNEQSAMSRRLSYKGRWVKNIYNLDVCQGDTCKYAETEFTAANRQALIAWRDHAKLNGYRLTFLLIPHRDIYEKVGFFAEIKDFMHTNEMDYIDLSEEFRTLEAGADQLYLHDGLHLSPDANRLVAEILVRRVAKEVPREKALQ